MSAFGAPVVKGKLLLPRHVFKDPELRAWAEVADETAARMEAGFCISTGKVTLSSNSTKSLILMNPVTNEAKWYQVDVSMDASAVITGVEFDIYKVTTLGSPAGTSTTPQNTNPTQQAATTTALTALSSEPTTVQVIPAYFVQPVAGLFVCQFPLGREMTLAAAGARWGVRYVTPTATPPDCIATAWIGE